MATATATTRRSRPARATAMPTATAEPMTATKAATPARVARPRARPLPGMPKKPVFQRTAGICANAGDPTRLAILYVLSVEERNVGDLAMITGQAQPALSHHLAILRHSRLVQGRREGKSNFYTLTDGGRRLWDGVRGLLAAEG